MDKQELPALTSDQARAIAQATRTSASDPASPIACVRAGWDAALTAQSAEIARLTAEVEGLRKDAERYRWLRDHSEPGICAFYLSVGEAFKGVKFARETVDEAIDAQIAAMKEKTNEHR